MSGPQHHRSRFSKGRSALPVLTLAALSASATATAAEPAPGDDIVQLPTVEIVGQTPLPASSIPLRDYPGNLQTATSKALEDAQTTNLAQFLARNMDGVHVADAANNPFQPDLFYRGYSVSPLLGLPQGLALYQDGVRVNEVFGDTVNWDLIPEQAIAGIELVPDSNPLFGQNAIGGSLVARTKNGFDYQGAELEAGGGSFGRWWTSADYGVAGQTTALYVAAQTLSEDGWRDHSKSEVNQLFARGSWRPDDKGQLDLTVTAADNRLRGNGAVPIELMEDEGRDAVFTYPDETKPEMLFVNLFGQRKLSDTVEVGGNFYVRRNNVHAFNGDGTEFEACEDPANVDADGAPYLCEFEDDGEEVVEDTDDNPVVASDDNDSGTQNRSRTRQRAIGGGLQMAWKWHEQHKLTFGGTLDFGRANFLSGTELASLTDERGTVGSGIFVEEAIVHVKTRNDNIGLYALDTWQATDKLLLSFGGRYNHTEIQLRDQDPEGDLSGDHQFDHFNPMIGASLHLSPQWTAFASASQATRAPTPVELTCANPDDPCRLPNGFVDDPPLDQVVTRTLSLGLRQQSENLRSTLSLFHALSKDDIIFITDGNLTNQGYFDNVGDTLRQGVEASFHWKPIKDWSVDANYTYLIAEFREDFLVNTPNHAVRDEDDEDEPAEETREVSSGDRIPLIPHHLVNASVGWERDIGALRLEAVGRSKSRYRGDEANVDSEQLKGFVLFNLYGELRPLPRVTLFARVENLFDRDYETFGTYGEADEVLGDEYEDARRFVGPGAPQAFYAGIRINLGSTNSL